LIKPQLTSQNIIVGLEDFLNYKQVQKIQLIDSVDMNEQLSIPSNDNTLSLANTYFEVNESNVVAGEELVAINIMLLNKYDQKIILPQFQAFDVQTSRIEE
jgi:hypothetical protein